MRAIVITRPGDSGVLEERAVESPRPGPEEILVRVRASALNRADISQRRGSYPAPPGVPADIPGLEYAGEVEAIGENATRWKIGDAVMGLVGGGAHAELVCTHEREAMRVPARLTFEEAASIPEAFLTAYDAVFRQLAMQVGQRLLIHAAGSGVGTAAVQLARRGGLRTVGTSRSASKLEKAAELGLENSVVASGADWPELVLEVFPDGVDAVLDLVGGNYLAGNMKVLVSRGRIMQVGVTGGRESQIQLGVLMQKRLQLVGTVLRSRPLEEKIALVEEFADRLLPFFDDGSLMPVVHSVISFSEISRAHDLMESNDTFGKIVLNWS
ncbi:MAG TPA: NAD(P)H-quinone oxidoreductase [Gemmatimonadaceae bacterium]|nr:NAD(P)H-quinone oxidoreductase [Gemmatimonadaceae bacterium]